MHGDGYREGHAGGNRGPPAFLERSIQGVGRKDWNLKGGLLSGGHNFRHNSSVSRSSVDFAGMGGRIPWEWGMKSVGCVCMYGNGFREGILEGMKVSRRFRIEACRCES